MSTAHFPDAQSATVYRDAYNAAEGLPKPGSPATEPGPNGEPGYGWTVAVNVQRIAEPGHVARNGNQPRTAARVVPESVELVDSEDEHGGRLTSPALLCPECGAPVRCVVS